MCLGADWVRIPNGPLVYSVSDRVVFVVFLVGVGSTRTVRTWVDDADPSLHVQHDEVGGGTEEETPQLLLRVPQETAQHA